MAAAGNDDEIEREMYVACRKGHVTNSHKLVEFGFPVENATPPEKTPRFDACDCVGNAEYVEFITYNESGIQKFVELNKFRGFCGYRRISLAWFS